MSCPVIHRNPPHQRNRCNLLFQWMEEIKESSLGLTFHVIADKGRTYRINIFSQNKVVSDMMTIYNNFNSKEKKEKATQRLKANGMEQSGERSGEDSGYNTTSRESTLSPKVASPEVTPFPSQYFGADGSAPSTSSQY